MKSFMQAYARLGCAGDCLSKLRNTPAAESEVLTNLDKELAELQAEWNAELKKDKECDIRIRAIMNDFMEICKEFDDRIYPTASDNLNVMDQLIQNVSREVAISRSKPEIEHKARADRLEECVKEMGALRDEARKIWAEEIARDQNYAAKVSDFERRFARLARGMIVKEKERQDAETKAELEKFSA
jgi:hypothetical protein